VEEAPPEGNPVIIYMPDLDKDPDFPGFSIIISNLEFAKKQAELGKVTHWVPAPPLPLEEDDDAGC